VSIGLPVYNCAVTLDAAVRSILNQTFRDWELLLIDDGSTDETVRLARSYADQRIRVFEDDKHLGLAARLNQAVSLGRGRYFARMDGDDVSYPERLALQVEYLEGHPEIDLLGGGILIVGRCGEALGTRESRTTHEQICGRPWAGFYLAHPTWVGRMEWFREHPYRPQAVRCEDQDLLLRTYENSHFAALPEIVLGYREEELSLKKILLGRRSYVRSAFSKSFQKHRYSLGWRALLVHVFKGLIECAAVGTGLNYRILRHRALPTLEETKRRWIEIWQQVQMDGQSSRTFDSIVSKNAARARPLGELPDLYSTPRRVEKQPRERQGPQQISKNR
jgi:glycosyltransferase involved in cell wall biosynthesis